MTILLKMFGQLLFIVGLFGLWHFWSADTSVYSPGRLEYEGGVPVHIPGARVQNIGKLNDRSNGLMISGLGIVVGTLFMLLPRDSKDG